MRALFENFKLLITKEVNAVSMPYFFNSDRCARDLRAKLPMASIFFKWHRGITHKLDIYLRQSCLGYSSCRIFATLNLFKRFWPSICFSFGQL